MWLRLYVHTLLLHYYYSCSDGKLGTLYYMNVLLAFMWSAVPTEPRQVSITRYLNNDTGIEVNWLPPRASNGNISYFIQYSTDEEFAVNGTVEVAHSGGELYANITNLEQGVLYYVRVVAATAAGQTAGAAMEHMFAGAWAN